jgi:CxxC motif-containing protein (DUF1111 family)
MRPNHREICWRVGLLIGMYLISGCDTFWTEAPPAGEDFQSPLEGLSPEALGLFLEGDEAFGRVFRVGEGLGPLFNEGSCEGCHPGDGRGRIENVVPKFSRGLDVLELEGGPVLQMRAIAGASPERLPEDVQLSLRLPPPVFGVGLIEAIPDGVLEGLADEGDADGDGISGRPNWVEVPEFFAGGGVRVGRFGRKGGVASLAQQVAEAYLQDMGITSDFFPFEANFGPGDGVADPEISSSEVLKAVSYVRMLSPPAKGEATERVLGGQEVFRRVGCEKCHVPMLRTGASREAAFDQIEVWLYSDLLLHDMGEGLADGRADGQATGTEWKTAPLWGLRLASQALGQPATYLHDGRAKSLDEAIRLHGGEAQSAQAAYGALPEAERAALIAFLESL